MVAIRAEIGREEQEEVVCGPVIDSLLQHPTLKSMGLIWIETYLGLTWLAEAWEIGLHCSFSVDSAGLPKQRRKQLPPRT